MTTTKYTRQLNDTTTLTCTDTEITITNEIGSVSADISLARAAYIGYLAADDFGAEWLKKSATELLDKELLAVAGVLRDNYPGMDATRVGLRMQTLFAVMALAKEDEAGSSRRK